MFCGKCGAKNSDNAQICTNCGAKLKKSNSKKRIHTDPIQDAKNKKIGIIAVVTTIIIIVIIGTFLFGGRSYKSTIDKFINETFNANGEAILDLMPEKMIDYALAEENYDSDELEDLIDDIDDELQEQVDYFDKYFGEGWTVSYEIVSEENVTGDDLDEIIDKYDEVDVEVSEAKKVEVEITVNASETETSNSLHVPLIKSGRSWYLDAMSMGSLF